MATWIRKIKNLLFGFKGTLIYCPNCTSANVSYGKITNFRSEIGLTQSYPVMCHTCDTEGFITESWFKEKI